jgi:hypothetical protein
MLMFATALTSQLLYAQTKRMFEFDSIKGDKAKFVSYSSSIQLSAEQQQVRKQALSSITSPCCDEQIAGSCCDCEAARSILGLSNYLIAEYRYDYHQDRYPFR